MRRQRRPTSGNLNHVEQDGKACPAQVGLRDGGQHPLCIDLSRHQPEATMSLTARIVIFSSPPPREGLVVSRSPPRLELALDRPVNHRINSLFDPDVILDRFIREQNRSRVTNKVFDRAYNSANSAMLSQGRIRVLENAPCLSALR
jgi:hypothetical protein